MGRTTNSFRSVFSLIGELRRRNRRRRDPIGYARWQGAKIGRDCRLINCDFGSEPFLVTLGDHVSATETAFVTHDGGV